MKIIQLSDIHGNPGFVGKIEEELRGADVIALTGDVTMFGSAKGARAIVERIMALNGNVIAVPGNCDPPGVVEYLSEAGISLHGTGRRIEGYFFAGFGGSLPCPGRTPLEFDEEEIASGLELAVADAEPGDPVVLVMHTPPFGSVADILSSGVHSGSRSLADFIRRTKPLLCMSGHIHESAGEGFLGDTLVVNPGPAPHGMFALITIDETGVRAELRHA